jgi:hypothetical protein
VLETEVLQLGAIVAVRHRATWTTL